MARTYRPPMKVAQEARRGLEMWHDTGRKCATAVGVRRAHQLMKRQAVSLETVKRMWKFFNRHFKNRKNAPPRCGKIAWLLWGGDSGLKWARGILEREKFFD